MSVHPGSSHIQQRAEGVMLELLGKQLGVKFAPAHVDIGDSWVQIDGVSQDPPILVEAWAHHGKLKGSQPDKVATDILKLATAADEFKIRPRLILLFADENRSLQVHRHVMACHGLSTSWDRGCGGRHTRRPQDLDTGGPGQPVSLTTPFR